MEANLPLNEISEPLALVSEWSGTASEFMFGLFSLASTSEFSSVNISHYFPLVTSLFLYVPPSLSPQTVRISLSSARELNMQYLTIFHHTVPCLWAHTRKFVSITWRVIASAFFNSLETYSDLKPRVNPETGWCSSWVPTM